MGKFWVFVGDERIDIDAASSHQDARWQASTIFKERHSIDLPIDHIFPYAKARKLPTSPKKVVGSVRLVEQLKEMSEMYKKEKDGAVISLRG